LPRRVAPALQPNEDDLQVLATARRVVNLLEQRSPSSPVTGPPSPSEALRLAQEVMPMLPELLPGITRTGELFARQLVKRVALRVANDMEVHRDASGLRVER
jgi:aarF domain-containing kinase